MHHKDSKLELVPLKWIHCFFWLAPAESCQMSRVDHAYVRMLELHYLVAHEDPGHVCRYLSRADPELSQQRL